MAIAIKLFGHKCVDEDRRWRREKMKLDMRKAKLREAKKELEKALEELEKKKK